MLTRVLLIAAVLLGWNDWATEESASAAAPVASQGYMDLSDWHMTDKDGAVRLSGEWLFYWHRLLTPEDRVDDPAQPPAVVAVPGIWSDYRMDGQPLPNIGYATYRLVVRLDPQMAAEPKWLYMPSVATAYRLWVNGELAAENGRVGTSRAGMTPRNVARIVPIRSTGDQLDIVIQVSNFVQRKGGLWKAIMLGTYSQIGKARELNVVYALGFSIGLYVMGLYHLFLYLPRRFDRSPLWFALLCFAVGTRTLFVGETLAVHWFPALTWELATRLEYLSANSAMVCLLVFVSMQFPGEAAARVRNLLLMLEGLFIGFVLAVPAIVYTQAMWLQETLIVLDLLFILYVTFLAAARRREGARVHLIGLLFILLAVLNDIFMYGRWLRSVDLSPLGLFAYLFAQSVVLSHRFAKSFAKVRNLSAELQQANLTLESRIDERTAALRHANESLREVNARLSQVEDSRRRLLSNITHEMGNPLTSLQGYLHAAEDGLIRGDEARIFGLIRQKIGYLDQMIQDLVELSRLETQQILFQYHSYPFHSFVRQLIEKYEWDVARRGVRFLVRPGGSPPTDFGQDVRVWIDPLRMEQVFVNLLFNALKFTPEGGTIALEYGMMREAAELMDGTRAYSAEYVYVSIRDTGRGIAPEELPHVFERFYKGGSRRAAEEGGGLGLSIAKEIVDRHGGTIEAISKAGEGSTFRFRLPLCREGEKKCEAPQRQREEDGHDGKDGCDHIDRRG